MNRTPGTYGMGGLIAALLLAVACSGEAATPGDMAVGMGERPNVVFILTDDLAWNLVKYMPHVLEMQRQGTTFSHYYVTDSLCCPSRSSIFTGKYPHDTKVFVNSGPMGGYAQFERVGNAAQTFAATLHGAGYRTAMMGKYLNGYEPTKNQADPGWSEWDVAGNGYPEFNYQVNQNGALVSYGAAAADYGVDVLAGLADKFVRGAGSSPFLVEVATFAPHAPYTPAPRYLGKFHEMLPRTPAFNTANKHAPMWLAGHMALTAKEVAQLDTDFNLRVEAVQAVDDLIGRLFATAAELGIDKRTYFVFSSDNGYHMGDHMLHAGKETAFDTDINVPLIVVGPSVPAGVTVDHIVENIDLCPTFAELSGTAAPATADGRSLVPFLNGQGVSDWRNVALIEHHGPELDPRDPNDPDNEDRVAPPNSYEAIRMADSVYVEYQDGESEYYDLSKDPYETDNTAASLTPAQVHSFHKTLTAIKDCHNSGDCWTASKLQP